MTTNPQLQPLSASQISTFIGCNRRWAYEYLEGKRPPPHPSAALGSEIHRQLEEWLKNKVMPTHSAAVPGIQHAPPPGIGVVEERISFATPNSLWRGAIDLHYDLEQGKSWLFRAPFSTGPTGTTVIQDWKSSGNARYNKTVADLLVDGQANLYAFWAFGKGAQRVEGKWVYLATKGQPKADPVHVKFEKSRVGDEVGKLDLVAKEAQTLYQIRPKSSELPVNLDSCSKFGGCPHASYCDKGASSIMNTDNSDFMRFIAERTAAVVPQIPTAPVAPPPPVLTAPSLPVAPPAPPAPPVVPVLPEMDESTAAVFDYMTTTLKKSAAEALALLGISNPVPSAPVAPAAPELPALPEPEAGFVNPPEAAFVTVLAEPPVVPELPSATATPKKAETVSAPDQLDTLDRDALKKIAVFLGVMDTSNRFGEPKIRQLIRSVNGWEQKIGEMGRAAAPVTVPETVQSEFEEKMRQAVTPIVDGWVKDGIVSETQAVELRKEEVAPALKLEDIAEDVRDAVDLSAFRPVTDADFAPTQNEQTVDDRPLPQREIERRAYVAKQAEKAEAQDEHLRGLVREVVREEIRAALKEFFSKLGG